ncbi:hypothetical protein [Streptomyces sp. NPDC049879]|uniref:hypothetical protein n=1 Tax=Streptomyces sp. NPDC049879 TaxID=3365598 RepID=UPI0037B47233
MNLSITALAATAADPSPDQQAQLRRLWEAEQRRRDDRARLDRQADPAPRGGAR